MSERTRQRIRGILCLTTGPKRQVISNDGNLAIATLVERHSRYLIIPGLKENQKAEPLPMHSPTESLTCRLIDQAH